MKKRKINGQFLVLISLFFIILVSVFKIPSYRSIQALKKLGYEESTIEILRKNKLAKSFIELSLYSPLLEKEIQNGKYDEQYLNLYLSRDSLDDEDKNLYQSLKDKYTTEELDELFLALDYREIRPLLLFDKIEKIENYINDLNKNGLDNLKGSYLKPYNNITQINNPSSLDVLVNLNRCLGEYVPDVSELSRYNAIEGVKLEVRAKEAFENELCPAMRKAGCSIYAIGGYVSYETQFKLFDYFDLEEEAIERNVFKPGFNEKQTGLIVSVVDTDSENVKNFKNSNAYAWLKEHAHEYGFIFRYPNEKSSITLITDDYENQLRYLGKELAMKVYESGLSYDEYILYSE